VGEEEPSRWPEKGLREWGEERGSEQGEDGLLLELVGLEREEAGRKKQQWREREKGEVEETGSKLTAVGEGREWWWGHVTWHVPLPAAPHRESQP